MLFFRINFINEFKFSFFQDTLFNGLGLRAIIGLGVAALLLILVVIDVSCFFVRQCGLLMCITRRICGKKSGSSGKSKELEEGKAAYLWVLFTYSRNIIKRKTLLFNLDILQFDKGGVIKDFNYLENCSLKCIESFVDNCFLKGETRTKKKKWV